MATPTSAYEEWQAHERARGEGAGISGGVSSGDFTSESTSGSE
ncbi:hypothetical protein [Streptomyces sp. NPDC050507]